MKRFLQFTGVLLVAFVGGARALAQTASEIELTRTAIQTDRQAIVTASMDLTEDEAMRFWPVYREYRTEMARVGDRIVKLLTDYASSYPSMTDERAAGLVDEMISVQSSETAVRKKYLPKFQKAIPARKVLRFYQIENRLDTIIRAEVQQAVPLAK